MTRRAKLAEIEVRQARKMTSFETYIALIKGYCGISVLLMPRAFQHGGWFASAGMEIGSAFITTLCAAKLV